MGLNIVTPDPVPRNLLAEALDFRAVLLKALLLLPRSVLTPAGSTQNLDIGGAGAFRADILLRLAVAGLAASSGATGRLRSIATIE